jgi:tetratricopeptide (TPR) repeat protein
VVISLIEASEQYIGQGLVWAALDACHEVIRLDTDYLPIHLRLSEIYERQGHINDALTKYRTLIDTYVARERAPDAITVYERIIDLAPDDLDTRAQLVAVLRDAGRIDAAATEAITVANTAFRLGQTSRALEIFEDIHTWATPSATLHIEHGRALLKLECLLEAAAQWRQATERDKHHPLALALHVLGLALVEPPSAMLWNTFATLLDRLAGDETQLAVVQGEYRLALLLADSPVLHLLLGLLQQTAQQHDLALMSFEQALSSLTMDEHPELASLLVHQAMVRSYLAQKDKENALEHLHVVQLLLFQQPVPTTSPHAFARALTPAEVQRMIAALDRTAHSEAAPTSAPAAFAPTETVPNMGAVSAPGQPVHSEPPPTTSATGAPQRVEHSPVHTTHGDAQAAIAAAEAAAQRLVQAGRDDEALTALGRAAMHAWMLGQHNEAARLVEQGVAWVPQHLRAWQQQVHVFLLMGDVARAAAAQREIMQLARMGQPHVLAGSVQQMLVLVPDDPAAQALASEQASAP